MSLTEWILVSVLGVIAIPYVLGPFVILATFKLQCPTRIQFFDPDALQAPPEVTEFLGPADIHFAELGFEAVAYFCLPELIKNAKSISVLAINPGTGEGAMASCVYGEGPGGRTVFRTKYFEFVTRFRDGVVVQTNNSREIGTFRDKPDTHTIQFWDVEDIGELCRRHRKIGERLSKSPPRLRLTEEFRNDVEQFLQKAVLSEPAEYQVELGLLRRVPGGYCPTLRGAFIFTWQELWPWKLVRRRARRWKAKQWLQDIGP